MQSLPSAAPATLSGFPAGGLNPSFTGCSPGSPTTDAASSPENPDAESAGFADLLANTQSAPSSETDAADAETDSVPVEPRKSQAPNLLLACLIPTIAQPAIPLNENPLTPDPGEASEASLETSIGDADADAPNFRFSPRDARFSTDGLEDAAISTPATATAPRAKDVLAQPLAEVNPPEARSATPAESQDLTFKLDFTSPRSVPDHAKKIPEIALQDAPSATPDAALIETLAGSTASVSEPAAAKIAPSISRLDQAAFSGRRRSELKFLSPDQSRVTKSPEEVGTAVAKSMAEPMPTLLKANLSSEDNFAPAPVVLATSHGTPADMSAANHSAAPTAKSAVQQVVAVMEAEAHETATANLKMDFDFGDARLTVRVEMRDGTLQAHFHTDSASLQSSLSREWHVAASSEPEKFSRFAEPSFNSPSTQDSLSGQSQGDARRDSSHARQAREESNSFGSFFRRSRSTARPFAPASTPVNSPVLPLSQLNTFA